MTTIDSFVNRLKKIGIEVELIGNYPWVYLDKVNGMCVFGKLHSEHRFTVFFRATRMGEVDRITDITLIFKKIRETLNREK